MEEKQAPPSYSEASSAYPASSYNAGYAPPSGDLGGNPQPYGPQPGYPAGYSHPTRPDYPPQQTFPSSQYAHQQTVVVTQPTAQGMAVNVVPDNMGMAIFTTILCCWPLGLVAIMRAQESRRAMERGDIATAMRMSTEARRYSVWAIIAGCITIAISVTILVVVITQSSTYYSYSY